MDKIQEYLNNIGEAGKRERLEGILEHIAGRFPGLQLEVKWNQPMFTDHGTFILAFSVSKGHIAVSPEKKTLDKFREEIEKAGYVSSKMLFRIKWEDEVDYDLLDSIVEYNINDKKDTKTFWR